VRFGLLSLGLLAALLCLCVPVAVCGQDAAPPANSAAAPPAEAQAATPAAEPPANPPADALPQPSAEQQELLRLSKEGILNAGTTADRRRWAKQLLGMSSLAGTNDILAEILRLNNKPEAQLALCEELAERPPAPALLVDPLLQLLAAGDSRLPAAAALVLADIPGERVVEKLGALAANGEAPMPQRLAALDALALRIQDRAVVGRLIDLLELGNGAFHQRIVTALAPVADRDLGHDVEAWKAWRAAQDELSESQWLARQLRLARRRARSLEDQCREERERGVEQLAALSTRISEMQRNYYRMLPTDEQREEKLAAWLADPTDVVQRMALSLISSRIADDGYRPRGNVLQALLALLDAESVAVRQDVLLVLPHVDDPAVPPALLARIAVEDQVGIRVAILSALGRLGGPETIPTLLEIIRSSQGGNDAACVREAATALGQIAGRLADRAVLAAAVEPLRERYRSVPPEAVNLRAALLGAMAGVADASFAPDFAAAVDAEQVDLLRSALRGLAALGDRSKLPRCRSLAAHPDARVRHTAIEALGKLGHEEADVEALLARLNPTIEQDAVARDAAYVSFRSVMSRQPIAQRLAQAERLRDIAGLEQRYLQELERTLLNAGQVAELEVVQRRLAEVLFGQGLYAEAAQRLNELLKAQRSRNEATALATGLRLLEVTLQSQADPKLAPLLGQLAGLATTPEQRAQIVTVLAAYLDGEAVASDAARSKALLQVLEGVPADSLGDTWPPVLERLRQRVAPPAPPPTPPPDPAPAGGAEAATPAEQPDQAPAQTASAQASTPD
jgi:HEAT repeat protein